MPAPAFFRQLGLYVLPNFVTQDCAAQFCQHMAAAPAEKGVVVGSYGNTQIDRESRRVDSSILPKETTSPLKRLFREIKPALEEHFGMALGDCEPPQFLIYNPGDFFKAHRDVGGAEVHHAIQRRVVSVVIFLNQASQTPSEGSYGDGQLVFYGLLEGAQWEKCAFPLDAEPGLLIAFPSDKWHEVKPVSHGQRFTMVTWFHAPDLPAEVPAAMPTDAPTENPIKAPGKGPR